MSYSEMLLDPRWQKLRLKKLEESGWSCRTCGDTESTLHVHHIKYVKGRKPWEYGLGELQVLCKDCHKEGHEAIAALTTLLADAEDAGGVVGLVYGFLDGLLEVSQESADSLHELGCGEAEMIGVFASILRNFGPKEWYAAAAGLEVVLSGMQLTPTQDQVMKVMLGRYRT